MMLDFVPPSLHLPWSLKQISKKTCCLGTCNQSRGPSLGSCLKAKPGHAERPIPARELGHYKDLLS